ncbi:membrane or secreted protein containing Peptidase M23 domain protein [Candidatus Magnetomorum sp. HK-1]|nr:membrane or secreted protein containing Peptidase M23 domain protein [Candidatus Magnetomorum sp. HK-1]
MSSTYWIKRIILLCFSFLLLTGQTGMAACYSQQSVSGLPVLFWPLEGKKSDYSYSSWDYVWTWNSCGGKSKRHVGIDIVLKNSQNTAGQKVYAVDSGYIKAIYDAGNGWGKGITIEHKDKNGKAFTSNYTHVVPKSGYSNGSHVKKGTLIGEVQDLNGKSTNHLHFSIRRSSYSNTSNRGALPIVDRGNCKCGSDPVFPEYFVDPDKVSYSEGIILSVYDFWKKNDPNPICADPSSDYWNPNFDAQYKIKNDSSSSVLINRLALSIHYSDNSFWFDLRSSNSSSPRYYDNIRLSAGQSFHFDFSTCYFRNAGSYKLVAKAKINGQWYELDNRDVQVIDCGGCRLTNGDWAYCSDCGPCSDGQGDCDSKSECKQGTVCVHDVGAKYGWSASVDVCEKQTGCQLSNGDWAFCSDSKCGPCKEGYGDCDSNSECKSGLVCVDNVGAKYGWSASVDVCEKPSQGCRLNNGNWSYCSDPNCGPCDDGQGDCDSNSECKSGLTCKSNVGSKYGWSSGVDVCEKPGCSLPNGDWAFCSKCGPCSYGQGDCDGNSECGSGLQCKNNVGAKYGWSSGVDVCE